MMRWRGGLKRARKGFSLIELMIVVAIVGILASIAIPNFLFLQCKAKRSEAFALIGALKIFQNSYYQETGQFVCAKELLRPLGYDFSAQAYTTIELVCAGDTYTAKVVSLNPGPNGADEVYTTQDGMVLVRDGCVGN